MTNKLTDKQPPPAFHNCVSPGGEKLCVCGLTVLDNAATCAY